MIDAEPTAPPSNPVPLPALPSCESYSSLTTYEACPQRYAFRYVEHLPGEDVRRWYAFGSAVHSAFEAFDRARIAARTTGSPAPGYDALVDTFTRKLDGSGCEPDDLVRLHARAEPVLRAFFERELASSTQPVSVEIGFGVDVAVGEDELPVRFVGYIDRVDRRPDGAIEVIDHKTGRLRSQADVDGDVQLTAYAFACGLGALCDPDTGETLPPPARLGLHFAEPGETVWTTRSSADLEAFEKRLTGAVGRIRARDFVASPGADVCRWCEYRATCPDVTC